jgi:hypothetical protein
LIDTSRTDTGALAKIATKQLEATEGGLEDDTLADIDDEETVITPPDSLGQFTYLCQTNPPVTHSA